MLTRDATLADVSVVGRTEFRRRNVGVEAWRQGFPGSSWEIESFSRVGLWIEERLAARFCGDDTRKFFSGGEE